MIKLPRRPAIRCGGGGDRHPSAGHGAARGRAVLRRRPGARASRSLRPPPLNAALRESPRTVALVVTELLDRTFSTTEVLNTGALWGVVGTVLLLSYRPTLRRRLSACAGDIALVSGTLCMVATNVLLFGVEASPGRTLVNTVERSAASIDRGATLLADNCAQCHGATGGGDGPLAATLPAVPANFRVHLPFHPDGTFYSWITDGIRCRHALVPRGPHGAGPMGPGQLPAR